MKYMGSKARHARDILPIILSGRTDGQWYVEPFVGGANVIDKVDGNRIGADLNLNMIRLLDSLSSGWLPPRVVSEIDYIHCKENQSLYPLDYLGYVSTQLSYGGKVWGGYRRDKTTDRNYSDEAFRHAVAQAPGIYGVQFHHCSYDDMPIPQRSIIYCDPPYQGATGYATGAFDHDKFWKWCRDKVAEGHKVYVSEYNAPDDWVSVWQKTVNNTLTKDTGSKKGVERLFVMRGHEPIVAAKQKELF